MKIRDVEVEFDFLDADDMERFETELQKVKDECDLKEKKEMSCAEVIREECRIIDDFFNNVFGEGIAEKIFKGKKNLNEHVRVFEDIVNEKIKQQKDLNSAFERYQPNRETRRYNKYHKR